MRCPSLNLKSSPETQMCCYHKIILIFVTVNVKANFKLNCWIRSVPRKNKGLFTSEEDHRNLHRTIFMSVSLTSSLRIADAIREKYF